MVNRNIQMKKRNNDTWENLFPLTLNENVFNNEGIDLDTQFDDLNSQLDDLNTQLKQQIDNEIASVENNITNVENDLNDYIDKTGIINLKDYDPAGDGLTDDTNVFEQAITKATNENKTLFVPSGKYAVNQIKITIGLLLGKNVEFVFNGDPSDYLLQIETNNYSFGNLVLNGDNKDGTLLRIFGSDNKFNSIELKNIELSTTTPRHVFGVMVGGDNNYINYLNGYNLKNNNYSNESFPQAVLSEGFGNVFNTIKLKDVASGLVTANKNENVTETKVNNLDITNASDNGIYNLSKSSLIVLNVSYNGSEEPGVFMGENVYIDNFVITGYVSRIGFQNVKNIRINNLHLQLDDEGRGANAIFRTRSGHKLTQRISIGEISGELESDRPGCQLFLLNGGTIKYLTIEKLNVIHNYRNDYSVINEWASLTAVEQFKIGSFNVKIVDLSNQFTSSDRFGMDFPSVIKKSYINELTVEIVNSDGGSYSDATFRGRTLKSENIRTGDLVLQTNIGPYARELNYGFKNSMNAKPTGGYFHKGEFYYNQIVSSSNTIGWLCIESGSPGTWREIT